MQYAFSRNYNGECVVVTVNNDESDYVMTLPVSGDAKMYVGALSGHHVDVVNGNICVNVKANKGDVWVPVHDGDADIKPVETVTVETVPVVDKAITIDTASGLVTETVVTEDIKVADTPATAPAATEASTVEEKKDEPATDLAYDEAFNKGKIAGLQEAIIAIMEKNGNVTDQMRRDVYDNVYHDSLITWIKSFR
jgi:hypothetical protein